MSCPPIVGAFGARTSDENITLELRSSFGLTAIFLSSNNPNDPQDENAITDDDWESDNSSGHEDSNPERSINTGDFTFKRLPEANIIRTVSNLSQMLAGENKETKASPLSRSMPDMSQHATCTRFPLSEHRILRPIPAEISTSLPTSDTATARPLSAQLIKATILTKELPKYLLWELLKERRQNNPTPAGYGSKESPLCKPGEWHLHDDMLQDPNYRGW